MFVIVIFAAIVMVEWKNVNPPDLTETTAKVESSDNQDH